MISILWMRTPSLRSVCKVPRAEAKFGCEMCVPFPPMVFVVENLHKVSDSPRHEAPFFYHLETNLSSCFLPQIHFQHLISKLLQDLSSLSTPMNLPVAPSSFRCSRLKSVWSSEGISQWVDGDGWWCVCGIQEAHWNLDRNVFKGKWHIHGWIWSHPNKIRLQCQSAGFS